MVSSFIRGFGLADLQVSLISTLGRGIETTLAVGLWIRSYCRHGINSLCHGTHACRRASGWCSLRRMRDSLVRASCAHGHGARKLRPEGLRNGSCNHTLEGYPNSPM